MSEIWYVEVTRQTVRFGTIEADTRAEAIEKVTQAAGGDQGGLTTSVGSWDVVAVHTSRDPGHHDDNDDDAGAIRIL